MLKRIPIRLILSIIAGIATATVLSAITHEVLHLLRIFPPLGTPMFEKDLLLITLCYHSFYAICGAIVTAAVAKEQAKKATFILGTKEAILWTIGAILLWKHAAPWFNLSKAVLGMPLAWIGGRIYMLYKGQNNQSA